MRRMYYHRFSGLRSCCIIIFLPILVILIFPILSPSSPSFLSFLLPLPFFISDQISFLSLRCTVTGFVKGKNPSFVVALLSILFFAIVTITITIFSRFLFSFGFVLCVSSYSGCVHGELDRPCSGRDDTGLYVLLQLLPIDSWSLGCTLAELRAVYIIFS